MIAQKKIPAWVAVLININIVVGSAFFLSVSKLSALGGLLAPLAWLVCGLMLLPLVLVFSRLAAEYPTAGGLYVYSQKQLGTLWGFISGWGYYIGTAAANAVVIHAFSLEFQKITCVNNFLSSYGLVGMSVDFFLITLFTFVNLLNIEFLESAQIIFAILKSLPLLLVILALPFLGSLSHFTNSGAASAFDFSMLFSMLPLVLFSYIGIEACTSIADKIEGGHRGASRVILISLLLITSIYTLLQCVLFCIHGTSSVNPFLTIIPMLTSNPTIISWGNTLIDFAILSSFLGGFYGMFYFNNWNLFTIGKEKGIVFHRYLIKQSKNQTPWVCVLVQSFLVFLFLLITQHDLYLMTMADFGTTIAYFLSVASFWKLQRSMVGVLALASCILFLWLCVHNLASAGFYCVIPFVLILLVGIFAHRANHYLL